MEEGRAEAGASHFPEHGQDCRAESRLPVTGLDADEGDAGGRALAGAQEVDVLGAQGEVLADIALGLGAGGADAVVDLDGGREVVVRLDRTDLRPHRRIRAKIRSVNVVRSGSKWPATARAYGRETRRA